MIDASFTCHANGKLLLSGEYFVLDGALALAVPTIYGQHFTATPLDGQQGRIKWTSLDREGNTWFQCHLQLDKNKGASYEITSASDIAVAERIVQILQVGIELNPGLLECPAIKVETRLEFDADWGLGSSSTLIYSIAKWLDVNPFDLLEATFGGSGYDIACAGSDGPVFYQRNDEAPVIRTVEVNWPFKENLHFVYLENKQDSRDGIWHYQNHLKGDRAAHLNKISDLSEQLLKARSLEQFNNTLDEHESYIAAALDLARVKGHRFPDFNGSIKSLGAWGGDFVLASSEDSVEKVKGYFTERGYSTVLSWKDLILE